MHYAKPQCLRWSGKNLTGNQKFKGNLKPEECKFHDVTSWFIYEIRSGFSFFICKSSIILESWSSQIRWYVKLSTFSSLVIIWSYTFACHFPDKQAIARSILHVVKVLNWVGVSDGTNTYSKQSEHSHDINQKTQNNIDLQLLISSPDIHGSNSTSIYNESAVSKSATPDQIHSHSSQYHNPDLSINNNWIQNHEQFRTLP